MKNYFNKLKLYISTHKILSIFFLITILFISYWAYGKITSTAGDIRYIMAKVEKGTIISSISGSGQVSASSQIDIKPEVSGTIVYIGAKPGDQVKKGKTLFSLDNKDAKKTVRDAEISLESAKLSLEKFKLQNSDENMNADLLKAYDDGFTIVSDVFLDLPSTIIGLESILGQENVSGDVLRNSGIIAENYKDEAEELYYQTKNAFEKNRINFRVLNRNSSKTDIESIINETYETTKLLVDAIKSTKNLVDYLAEDTDRPSDFVSSQDVLSEYTSTINGHLSNLLSIKTSIKNYKDAFPNADLDLQSSLLSVKQKENILQDAKDKLSDYYIGAPFDGTIASVPVNIGDSASSGTVLAIIITSKKLATISLNEVDVSNVKLGQKSTLTFDAIPDLTISGEVAEIDSIGTESQGVVTYDVEISFDTQDERVKAAMSVSALIITNTKENVFAVSNGAIKSKNGLSYIEMFDFPLVRTEDGLMGSFSKTPPKKIPVEVGILNDMQTEIISGLKEGDEIVTRTILPNSTKITASAPSMFGSPATKNGGGAIPGH